MKTITTYVADGIGDRVVEPLTIEVTKPLALPGGGGPASIREGLIFYRAEGKRLNDALREALPGGLYHALLVAMLDAKASSLRVPEAP